jgi:hypothetical protein
VYNIPVIESTYAIVPAVDFDPEGYLNQHDFGNARYKAKVITKNVVLQNINAKNNGKKIAMRLSFTFKKGEHDMPSAEIIHIISNEIVYESDIANKNSSIITLNSKLRDYKNNIEQ